MNDGSVWFLIVPVSRHWQQLVWLPLLALWQTNESELLIFFPPAATWNITQWRFSLKGSISLSLKCADLQQLLSAFLINALILCVSAEEQDHQARGEEAAEGGSKEVNSFHKINLLFNCSSASFLCPLCKTCNGTLRFFYFWCHCSLWSGKRWLHFSILLNTWCCLH